MMVQDFYSLMSESLVGGFGCKKASLLFVFEALPELAPV